MKIVTILGARPQFIKSAPVSNGIAEYNRTIIQGLIAHSHIQSPMTRAPSPITEFLIHTGQHYDHNMSQIFFKEMHIPEPHINLGIGSGPHGKQTGEMLVRIEDVLQAEKPDWVMVYGDTNSTLAGALASVKLHIPIAHIEAGLRSFNREMPEEINRVLADHCADILFCPTETAVNNLRNEGFTNIVNNGQLIDINFNRPLSIDLGPQVVNVGDTMYDAVLQFSEIARSRSTILEDLGVKPKEYLLATIHRPNNTDNPENLRSILSALAKINEPIIFPVHPRTRQRLSDLKLKTESLKLRLLEPVGYLDMLILEQNAKAILTDSGGMQKEAYWFKVPCITLRDETEWVETVEAGWNVVVGADSKKIVDTVCSFKPGDNHPGFYGDGKAAERIVNILMISA